MPASPIENNPIFQFDRRTVAWRPAHTREAFHQFLRLRVVLLGVICVVIGWLLAPATVSNYTSQNVNINETLELVKGTFLSVLFCVQPFLYFLTILAAFHFSLYAINQMKSKSQWEFLQLTTIPEEDVIRAKWVLARRRTWQFLYVEIIMRLGLSGFLLNTIFGYLIMIDSAYEAGVEFSGSINFTQLVIPFVIGGGIWLILEPICRMWAFTGIGLAISARGYSPGTSAMIGFFSMIGVWVGQIFSTSVVSSVMGIFFPVLFLSSSANPAQGVSETGFILFSLLSTITTVSVSLGFFVLVAIMCRAFAREWAFNRSTR
jgi:hypothetical protein